MEYNKFGAVYFRYLLLFSFFFPTFDLYSDALGFHAGTVLLRLFVIIGFLFLFVGLGFRYKIRGEIHYKTTVKLFSVFVLFFMLVNWSIANSLSTVILRDTFELHRPVYFCLLLFFPLFFLWSEKDINKYVVKTLIIIIVLEIIIGFLHSRMILQKYGVLEFFTSGSNIVSRRALGTYGNPYDYGVFMIFATAFFLVYAKSLGARKYLRKACFFVLAFFSLYAVFLSQSKTSFFTLIVASAYYIIFKLFFKPKLQNFVIIGFISILLLVSITSNLKQIDSFFRDNYSYLHSTDTFSPEKLYKKSQQKGNRLDDLRYALEKMSEDSIFGIIFGVGIGKSENDVIEFGYATYLYRYGILGFFIYLTFLGWASRYSFLAYKKALFNGVKGLQALFLGFHVWSVSLFIATMANTIIDQPRTTVLFFTITGLAISYITPRRLRVSAGPTGKEPVILEGTQFR
jgi:hypothetical protein